MKGRESGMPDEAYWAGFFAPDCILDRLLDEDGSGDLVEFGCGYGTFTLPAARRISGVITAFDIEAEMVEHVTRKAKTAGLDNIRPVLRDFAADGTGLETGTQSHAMIFNLLHLEQPVALLREAYRVLRSGGSLSVIHWRCDIPTPRGPSPEIRPRPEQCMTWIKEAGFDSVARVDISTCCIYHYGMIARR